MTDIDSTMMWKRNENENETRHFTCATIWQERGGDYPINACKNEYYSVPQDYRADAGYYHYFAMASLLGKTIEKYQECNHVLKFSINLFSIPYSSFSQTWM